MYYNYIKLFLLSICVSLYAQQNYIKDPQYLEEFPFLAKTNEVMNKMNSDPVLKNAKWGFSLYDPFAEKELIGKDSYDLYVPASTTKLITSESFLRLLGEDFTWKTQVSYTGYIDENGTLEGNLYVLWNGDPTLNLSSIGAKSQTDLFVDTYQSMNQFGIKKVNGKLIFESVVFDSDKKFYPYDDRMVEFDNYYSLIPTADDQLTNKEIQAEKDDYSSEEDDSDGIDETEMSLEDEIMMDAIKSLRTFYAINNLQSLGKSNSSLAAPPSYFSKKLNEYLAAKGIRISGGTVQQDYKNLETDQPRIQLMYYESPPVKDLIYMVDKKSSNHYAEQLMRTIGIFIGKRDTKSNSANTVKEKLSEINYYYNGLEYVDGSGLLYENQVSPISQVKYLSNIKFQPYFQSFYDSLPIAGVDGTLRNSFSGSPHVGSLHAKTGTLNSKVRTKTLAGYVNLANGEQLCFSILVNHYSGSVASVKNRMEQILNTVY